MKIVLYYTEQKSKMSQVVSFLTGSEITHASIINRGKSYDTDLAKDAFTESQILLEYPQRFCIVYDLGDKQDCQPWIDRSLGIPYDLLGYFLWIFRRNPQIKMHCFDTIVEALRSLGYFVPEDLVKRPTGDKLKNYLDTLKTDRTVMQCYEVE